jgi:hypothetical protein
MTTNHKNLTRFLVAALLLVMILLTAMTPVTNAQAKAKVSRQDFHDAMRKLWEDHITWTRLVIIGVFEDLPDLDPSVQRLLQNQADIGDAIKPFYGEAAGDQLTALLRDHILIAAEILQAAKNGDSAALEAASERWYANADDIAAFLNAANPEHWPLEEMRMMMREHLDLTLDEAVAYLNGDYQASIAAYDEVHLQILEMADMLSDGVIAQFPDKFSSGGSGR